MIVVTGLPVLMLTVFELVPSLRQLSVQGVGGRQDFESGQLLIPVLLLTGIVVL